MNLNDIKSLTFSLMKRETNTNKENKAVYSKKLTAKFTIPVDFPRTEEAFEMIVTDMYHDLMQNDPGGSDSIGLWVEYDSITIDNAMSLGILDDIQEYSKESSNPVFEFFKMTLQV